MDNSKLGGGSVFIRFLKKWQTRLKQTDKGILFIVELSRVFLGGLHELDLRVEGGEHLVFMREVDLL